MIIKVKKIYNGKVSPRDYRVQECLKRGEDLIIKVNDEKMTIPKDMVQNFTHSGVIIPARWGQHPTYELLDYEWNPDVNPQMNLF